MLPKKAVQDLVNAYKCFIESDEHNEGLGVGEDSAYKRSGDARRKF